VPEVEMISVPVLLALPQIIFDTLPAAPPVVAGIEIEPTVRLPAPVLEPKVTVWANVPAFAVKVSAPVAVKVTPSFIVSPSAALATLVLAKVIPVNEKPGVLLTVKTTPELMFTVSVLAGVLLAPAQPVKVAVPCELLFVPSQVPVAVALQVANAWLAFPKVKNPTTKKTPTKTIGRKYFKKDKLELTVPFSKPCINWFLFWFQVS